MEAYVIGSGPNGLMAAITLARAGIAVTVLEASPPLAATRSAELTLPGFTHDLCSAVHPLAIASPAFATVPLAEHGLEWIHPPIPVAHPLDGGRSVAAHRSIETTAVGLGTDAGAYRRSVTPFVIRWPQLLSDILAPPRWPAHPFLLARFGMRALPSAAWIARRTFRGEASHALFAGMAAHSILPLEAPGSAAIGWAPTFAAHAVGWPIPKGGSQRIANALASYLESLGGKILCNQEVRTLRDLPAHSVILADITPRQLLRIAADRLPDPYSRKLEDYRYGPAVFKIDWALHSPIPWVNPECARAGSVHVGGTFDEVARSERSAWHGEVCDRPFVLLSQPSLFYTSRAQRPAHRLGLLPCTQRVHQGHRQASSRRKSSASPLAFARRSWLVTPCPGQLELYNANLVGGDIAGGANTLSQSSCGPRRVTTGRRYEISMCALPPRHRAEGFTACAGIRRQS